LGYLLDELKNDITRETPASFEPSIDYVVTKIPRFALEVLAHGHHSHHPIPQPRRGVIFRCLRTATRRSLNPCLILAATTMSRLTALRFVNPNGIQSISPAPGLAQRAYPGKSFPQIHQL
jgi:hypothetical protein